MPVADLAVGDRVLVKPGARVPIDGVVEKGTSSVDESMLTGEPLPATRSPGDEVTGGTINRDGSLVVRVTRVGRDTALAQIVALVERAQSAKPPVQRLADRVSAVFVPTVLLLSIGVGIAWFAYGTYAGWPASEVWGRVREQRVQRLDHRLPVRARPRVAGGADGQHRLGRAARHPDPQS